MLAEMFSLTKEVVTIYYSKVNPDKLKDVDSSEFYKEEKPPCMIDGTSPRTSSTGCNINACTELVLEESQRRASRLHQLLREVHKILGLNVFILLCKHVCIVFRARKDLQTAMSALGSACSAAQHSGTISSG